MPPRYPGGAAAVTCRPLRRAVAVAFVLAVPWPRATAVDAVGEMPSQSPAGIAAGDPFAGAAGIEGDQPSGDGPASMRPKESGGMFMPADDGMRLWRQTLATVSVDWPIVRTLEPDFRSTPPRDGLIESAWVEPPTPQPAPGTLPAGIPRRQRVVVRVVPAMNGAWIDAIVETQSLAEEAGSAGPGRIELTGGWQSDSAGADSRNITTLLAARMAPSAEPIYALPALEGAGMFAPTVNEPPWAHSRHPRLSRAWHKVVEDYRNFYSCESLVCVTGAFGAGALMANTGFDTTMQNAWQRSVAPTSLGTFFADCKPIGEGRYALPIFGAAAVTGLLLEGRPSGDIVGEWGSRSLRMFVVGAPPVYVLQLATGASRPSDDSSTGSGWKFFQDDNGVSGHAFVGAIPFLAAAEMVENPWAKGGLYVCSTFVGFSRMTTDSHYPSQVFLGWYLAWASSMAVSRTETHFAGMEVSVVPLPIADLGGMAVEARW